MKMVEAFRDECHCEKDKASKELTTVKKVKKRAANGNRKMDTEQGAAVVSVQMTEHERWAESEAQQFDKISKAIRASAEQWRTMEPSAESMNMAQACFIKAEVWSQAASNLRRPYAIRVERDAMMEARK